jgi:hypothetical protein
MRRTLEIAVFALAATFAALVTGVGPSGAAAPHTQQIVVRPVHSNGAPVAGYTVSHESIPDFTCSGTSAGAVDANIEWCGFSSTGTVACWKSSNHTVLCLQDPMRKHLVRIHYQGAFNPVAAPHHPSPQSLVLYTGNYCLVRDGGAWSNIVGHPNWYGTYGCQHNAVYGGSGDGINRNVNPWRVHVANNPKNNTPHAIVVRGVKTAYYVGTAS